MNKMETTAQNPADVLHELRSLVREAEKILGEVPADSGGPTMAALRAKLAAARARLTDRYEEARRRVVDGVNATDETIRDHPYQALAIALGIGVVAGALLAGSGRESTD